MSDGTKLVVGEPPRRRFVQGLLLSIVNPVPARAQSPSLLRATATTIDETIQSFINAGLAPGACVAVLRQGETLLAKSYGQANLETATPMTIDSVFRVGSITKQFTASAIMLLAQGGHLSVDDPLAKYIPEISFAGPITLRMALTHTSGIHTYTDEGFLTEVRLPHTSQQMVEYIAREKPINDFAPGTAWRYSNSNFYLLGVVVERVSGQSLRQFLADRVISRAGLSATAIDRETDVVPNRASGYVPATGQPDPYRNADFISLDPPGGAGALRSTAMDMVHWHQALFAGQVVDAKSLKEMITPARLASGKMAIRDNSPATQTPQGYGFGLEIGSKAGEPAIGHGGGIPGFASYLVTFPRRNTTVVILLNGEPGPREPFTDVTTAVLNQSN